MMNNVIYLRPLRVHDFEHLHSEWITAMKEGDFAARGGIPYTKSTIQNNVRGLNHLFEKSELPKTVDSLTIQLLRKGMAKWPITPDRCQAAERRNAYKGFRSFFKFLDERHNFGAVTLSQTSKYWPRRITPEHQPKLQQREFDKLVEAIATFRTDKWRKVRLFTLVMTVYYSGLRPGELVKLEWKDHMQGRHRSYIDLDAEVISIFGKGYKIREVPMHPALVKILREWKATCWTPSRTVFNGWTYYAMSQSFGHLKRHAGIEINLHGLRRTMATLLCEQGADINAIQYLLGHEDVSTTMIYTRSNAIRAHKYMREFWNQNA